MRRATALTMFALVAATCGGDGSATTESSSPPAPTAANTAAPATTEAQPTTAAPSSDMAAFIEAFGEVGDCLLVSYTPAGDEFDYSVAPQRVDCSEPHDHQVFFVGELPGAPGDVYPADDIFDAVFFDLCAQPFEDRFGVDYDTAASLGIWAAWPFEAEWDAGLRTVKCSVTSLPNPGGGPQLIGDAGSAGDLLRNQLLAVGATFDGIDVHVYVFGESGEVLDVVNVTADGDEFTERAPVSWSPDGTAMTYSAETSAGTNDIFVIDVDSGEKINITNSPFNDYAPAFSPDGSRIVFGSDRTGGETNLFLMDADGSNVEQLTVHDGRDSSADWSPDGTQLVFRRRVDGNDDIWIVNADGTGARFLVGGPAGEYDPDWSPDGTRVAFISNEGGSFDIWTFEVESVTTIGAPPSLEAAFATRVTDHPGDEEYPDWTADSQSIVFHSNRHGVSTVWIMGADGSGQSALVFDFPVFWPQLAP